MKISPAPAKAPKGPVDRYLDRLLNELTLDATHTRRVLAEAEDHLRESARALQDMGLGQEEAERAACDRFGLPRVVARRFAEEAGVPLLPATFGVHIGLLLARFAGIGVLAIGLSGLLAWGFGGMFGQDFVTGDTNGVTYTAERCADFMKLKPVAADCASAATLHHYDEVRFERIDAGVLGLIILGGYWLLTRRYRNLSGVRVLPEGLSAGVGASAFGIVGAGLLLLSVGQSAFQGTTGIGGGLSAAIVSLAVFGLYARSLFKTVRRQTVRE